MLDQELESTGVGEETTSEGESQPTTESQQPESEQPKYEGNLDDDPRFREWKSNTDRRMNMLAKQAEAERAQREQLQAQWEQQYVQTLSEQEQDRHYRTQAEQQLAAVQQEMQQEREAIQKLRVLDEVSRLEDVPASALQSAGDVVEAFRLAKQYKAEKAATDNRPSPPPVDMGGGRPPASADDFQKQYDRAANQYDTSRMLDIMIEADKAGVTIRE